MARAVPPQRGSRELSDAETCAGASPPPSPRHETEALPAPLLARVNRGSERGSHC